MTRTIPGNRKKKSSLKKVKTDFPIVAIGASSGGLEAVTELLKNLRADTGMAFIFIQHLSPDYKSILVSLLAKSTKMKVQEIEEMEKMEPNNLYVIPYNKGIEVTDGHIQLIPRKNSTLNLSIDVLFTSLAETHHENAIGIILSGNASDGTMGLKAIKREGGITFAQDNSAKYGSMPESAINEGVADFILSPREIALELGRMSKQPFKGDEKAKGGMEIDDNDPDLKIIIGLLHKTKGVDFSHYKMGTIKRRIQRRMFLRKIKTLKQYAKMLGAKRSEVEVLYNDLLINVTDFFRDIEAFGYLKTTLFPKLLKRKGRSDPLRIWVAGCSTGQEAYSFAMLLVEMMGSKFSANRVQIFATDLSEQAIKKARTGEYSKYEVKEVSPHRLERFFVKINGNYRIDKSVRDMCVFAPHNLLSDAPFSRIDVISCCNMLIYIDSAMQKRVLATFHYALNDGGVLMLGKSEDISSSPLFSQINNKHKIYLRKKGVGALPDLVSRVPNPGIVNKVVLPQKKSTGAIQIATDDAIRSILFSRYLPTYVVINHAREVLQFKGETSTYLEHSTGRATLNILNMARPEIAFELRDSIQRAIETKREVKKGGIEIKSDGESSMVSLDVMPFQTAGEEPLLLVIFANQQQAEKGAHHREGGKHGSDGESDMVKKLKEALDFARIQLISVSEEKERANKILQTASEEILTSNEELQSMNEEMETSKEEIVSTNQELITTNQELQTRNEQLAEAYNFSEAIVTTLHEPILILDKHLRIRSSNKAFYKKFLVLQSDTIGKLLYELGNHQWNIPALRKLLANTIHRDTPFYDYEVTHSFPDIGKRTMLLNAMRIVQKVENEQMILLAFTDTTEKTLEQKAVKKGLEDTISDRTKALAQSYKVLEEKNLSLEKMNKELETFTFVSSHDLQEPLRKIKNFASCILHEEHKTLSGTGKDYLQRMQETVKRMQMLIEDLLTYARVKNTALTFEKTDLNKIAKEVIGEFKETIKEKKATINTGGLCKVSGIRFQFRQLLQNLIGNSLKFAHAKRPVRILIKSETLRGSKLNNEDLLPDTNYCHMTIADNGIGFDPKYKDRIFEVFQRLHEYDDYQGTGIGLAICKRIVEKHHGFITATGKLNKGARFDIYLPVV